MPDHTNPGMTDPSSQSYPPPPGIAAAPCSTALACSSGELQLPGIAADVIAQSVGAGLPVNSSGEVQFPGLAAAVAPASPGSGLAAEAHATDSCQTAAAPTPAAVSLPNLVEALPQQTPGGLAANVYVR